MLNILCALLSDRGRQICKERKVEEKWIENFVYLFELLLQLEQFCKMKEIPSKVMLDERRLGAAMDHVLQEIDGIIVRKGMGNQLIKNHLLLHLPHYVSRWGPLTGMDSGDSERNHKFEVKPQAKWTQRRESNFLHQFAKRWCETRLVRRAVNRYRRFWNYLFIRDNPPLKLPRAGVPNLQGTSFKVGVDILGRPAMAWSDKRKMSRVVHPQPVTDFLCHELLGAIADNFILGRTEISVRMGQERSLFRAHPNYRCQFANKSELWYDWATFELGQGEEMEEKPGQLSAFVELGNFNDGAVVVVRGRQILPNENYAVVRLFEKEPQLNFRDSADIDSQYTYSVKWGRVSEGFHLLPIKTIVGTALVIPNIEADPRNPHNADDPLVGGFFVLPSREQLGLDFLDVIDRESDGMLGFGNDDDDNEGEEEDEGEKTCKRVNFYSRVESKYI